MMNGPIGAFERQGGLSHEGVLVGRLKPGVEPKLKADVVARLPKLEP
jgi:hypothetical protein